MSKFNRAKARAATRAMIATETTASGRTYEGGAGFARSTQGELFLLAVANMVGEDTFYEGASQRDERYADLVTAATAEDPQWTADFLGWLRSEANMRSAAVVGAAEFVATRLSRQEPGLSRQVVDRVLQRADEPGEILAYWMGKHGRALPKPLKRGVADAVRRLYTERCVTPDTLVLKRNLSWTRAGDLAVGDELVGFDEAVRGSGKGISAKMRLSVVTATRTTMLESVRVITNRGETSVSTDHMFVVTNSSRNREWRRASDLRPGDRLVFFGRPWKIDDSHDAGWLAGYLDGEGYLNHKAVAVAQNVGGTLKHSKLVFKRLGFEFSVQRYDAKGNRHAKEVLKVLGGRYESMRLLGTVRPVRLVRDRLWRDGDLVSKGPHVVRGAGWATVTTIEPLGMRENVTMSTSTHTFIGDGFLCHNSLLKYDTASHGFRFGDVLDLTHPSPAPALPWQGALFRYALDRRHDHAGEPPATLRTLTAHAALAAMPAADRRSWLTAALASGEAAERLGAAGMTWESLASWLGGPLDAAAWTAMIPTMGFMAVLRNIRNFDEAGVPDDVAAQVAARLADPAQVATSRQLPMRFLSAYRAAPSLRWSYPLETALRHALANVPSLRGRTLVLVDTSGSMHSRFSKDGTLMRWDAAVLFGVALAQRCASADVVSFSSETREFPLVAGESLLASLKRWKEGGWFFGGGTETAKAVKRWYRKHDRVVILTDEQAFPGGRGGVAEPVPGNVPIYTWNLAGYKFGHTAGGPNRHTFGGLSDASFRIISLIEAGRDARWPWMSAPAT